MTVRTSLTCAACSAASIKIRTTTNLPIEHVRRGKHRQCTATRYLLRSKHGVASSPRVHARCRALRRARLSPSFTEAAVHETLRTNSILARITFTTCVAQHRNTRGTRRWSLSAPCLPPHAQRRQLPRVIGLQPPSRYQMGLFTRCALNRDTCCDFGHFTRCCPAPFFLQDEGEGACHNHPRTRKKSFPSFFGPRNCPIEFKLT